MNALSSCVVYASSRPLMVTARSNDSQGCESMYPVDAIRERRIEQVMRTDVMPAAVPSIVLLPALLHLKTPYLWPTTDAIVSPIPRLKIPAKGARGRSLNPEDIHFGSAHPSKREK